MAPGETKKIVVKISTHGYPSEVSKEIKVETNDPTASLITLYMKAKVFEALKATPRVVNFGRMAQNQTAVREITLENMGKKTMKITKVVADSQPPSQITVTPAEPFTLKAGESRKLSVKVSTGGAQGFLDSNLTLGTDLPYMPEKKVYMHIEVVDKPAPAQ